MAEQPSGALEGTTLHQLLSDDENRLLDAIDDLRSQGIGRLFGEEGLPQLIVCGDQSSGKSSVLEALTRVRFPTKSSVCTTFPTELRLRREPRSRISCRIKAAAFRTPEEKERLARFQESFESPEKFPDLITAARNCMSESTTGNANAFFEDVLEVEIMGPKLAPLTIVDLPGLIHYRSTSSGEDDIKLVKDLVQSYMKKSNSIILAVVSAHNDINNQIVLSHIKDIVPEGNRTLGIITKPDELPSGSEKEQEYLDYARTNPSKFHYGWHVVRNRAYGEQASSFEERDSKETAFFRDSNWNTLPRREVGLGVDSLRQKLSKMLLDHINLSLPSIVQRLEDDLGRSESDLNRLGDTRSSVKDQQKYLFDLSDAFGEYTRDALDGRYRRKSFFGDPLLPEGLEKRLRASVRNLNDEFASRMLKQGHKWHVVDDPKLPSEDSRSQLDHPNVIAKSVFLKDHVDVLAYHERGIEISGLSNPFLVGSLFQQQSEPWESIATDYLDRVWEAVKHFLETLLSHLTDERTCNQLLIHVIDPAMETKRQNLRAKLQELLIPHRHDPINIDPLFPQRVWSSKEERITRSILKAVRQELEGSKANISSLSAEKITAMVKTADPPVDDRYGSHQTFEFMQAYYEMTILVFINNTASLAVEQCLLTGIPKIFSSATIREMNDDKLKLIASESPDSRLERERVTERVQILKKGLQALKQIHPGTRANRNTAKATPKSKAGPPSGSPRDLSSNRSDAADNNLGTRAAASTNGSHNPSASTSSSASSGSSKIPSNQLPLPKASPFPLIPVSNSNGVVQPAGGILGGSRSPKPAQSNLFGAATNQSSPAKGNPFTWTGTAPGTSTQKDSSTASGLGFFGTTPGTDAARESPFGESSQTTTPVPLGNGNIWAGLSKQQSLFGASSLPASSWPGGFGTNTKGA